MTYKHTHPAHLEAARESKSRSEEMCQFCGLRKAEHAHHWRGWKTEHYLPEAKTTAAELTALCIPCHRIATKIREAYEMADNEAREKYSEKEAKLKNLEIELNIQQAELRNREIELNRWQRQLAKKENHYTLPV